MSYYADPRAPQHTTINRPKWRAADHLSAHGEVLANRIFNEPVQHPLAEAMVQNHATPSLLELAERYLIATQGEHVRGGDMRSVLAASTDHLGDLLEGLASRIALSRQPALLDPLLRFTRAVELNNYLESSAGTVELATEINAADERMRPWQTLQPSGSAESLALRSSPIRIRFPEQLVVNDDVNAIERTLEAAAIASAQNELESAFSLLNNDVVLADGANAFSAAAGNAIAGSSKDASGLNTAVGTLRKQVINGKHADVQFRYLLVPADDEITATKLIRDIYGDTNAVGVIATAYLDQYWYVAGDPDAWPWLLRATMRGRNGVSLGFQRDMPNDREGSRDLVLSALHTYDFAIASRIGAVRMAF